MKVFLANVRIAFADSLHVAKQVQGEGEPRHSLVAIIDPKSALVKQLDDAIEATAKEKWKEKAPAVLAKLRQDGRVCFLKNPKTNANGEVYEGFEGTFSVTASNKIRPLIIDRNPKVQLQQADGRPYSGCYCNVSIELWAQDNNWGRRINASLKGVQFVKDGDAFGGGTVASPDEFEDLGVPEAATDLV